LVVFSKDLKSELRNRYVINSLLMFVIVTISIIKFAIGSETVESSVLAGLLWIVIFFSASGGLARVFIKEEEKERIFEQFYRGQYAPSLNQKGAGLGLYMVKNLVQTYGGTINLHSEYGEGTKFSLIIPVY